MRRWYCANAEKVKKHRKVERSSEQWREWYRKNYAKNRERNITLAKERHKKVRKEALEAYGATCECCGEKRIEFLAFDHIKGGGNEHRRQVGKIAQWLKRNNYPKDVIRILCHCCNLSLVFYGYCPHKNT